MKLRLTDRQGNEVSTDTKNWGWDMWLIVIGLVTGTGLFLIGSAITILSALGIL